MAIQWDEEKMGMGFKEIDEQHKNFVAILNKLYELLYNPSHTQEQLGTVLDELLGYAVKHFDTEEKYFDEFNYEFADEHKQKHLEIKEKALDFKERFKTEGDSVIGEFISFLEDWLVEHLENEDRKYIKCFQEHGLK